MIRRTLILLALTGASAAPAAAQSGVVVDPSSPSGKEYAIPLDSARRDAAPSTHSSGGSGSAPLFGEGVGDSSAGSGSGSAPRSDGETSQRKSRRSSSSRQRGTSGSGKQPLLRTTRPVAAALPDGNSSSTLTVAAVALSVLLLGGVIGSIARRRG